MTQNISANPQNQVIYNKNRYNQQPQQSPNFTAEGKPISSSGLVQNNPLLNAAGSKPDNPMSYATAAILSTAGLMGLNNFINNPLLTKDYDDTIFKKIEINVDKFGNKPKVLKVTDYLSRVSAAAKRKIDNSEILRTLFRKPSLGGPQVESQAAGARGHLASRALEIMRKYKEHYKAANGVEFTGFDAILKKAEKDSYKYYDEIVKTIQGSSADLTKVISKRPWWGLGLIKNKNSLKEILNKDILIKNYKTGGTTLGQKASGYLMRGTEALTNGIFAGKFQVLLQAFFIAQSLSEASKAEKGEKFSTFMASLTELMAFMATASLQMKTISHLAGLKYIGMSPENVKKYQKAMQIANKAKKYGNHKAYAKAVRYMDALKNAAKANTKWYQKPLKWLGNFVSTGRIRETLKPLKASKIATAFANIPYGMKVGLGYVGRFALLMGVVVPVFSGIAKKVSYTLFGKPTKTIEREKLKEKMEAEKAKAEELQQQQALIEQMKAQQEAQQTAQNPNRNTPYAKPGNLVDRMQNKNFPPNPQQNPMGAQSMTPAASEIKSPDSGIKRTYIPNPYLGEETQPSAAASRTARINEAMRQADLAEMQASKYL